MRPHHAERRAAPLLQQSTRGEAQEPHRGIATAHRREEAAGLPMGTAPTSSEHTSAPTSRVPASVRLPVSGSNSKYMSSPPTRAISICDSFADAHSIFFILV